MRAPLPDRWLGVLIVVAVGSIGCIVEKPAPPRADVQGSIAFALTQESPVAIRAVRFEARPGAEPLSAIALRASVDEPSVDPSDRADVWVSIADPQTGALPGPSQYGSAGLGKSAYVGTCEVEGRDLRGSRSLGGWNRWRNDEWTSSSRRSSPRRPVTIHSRMTRHSPWRRCR